MDPGFNAGLAKITKLINPNMIKDPLQSGFFV